MLEISLIQGITLAIAVLGAVLGIINTWHSVDKTRVKLLVRPKSVIPVGAFMDQRLTFGIEVMNVGAIAVTVEEVGVLYRGSDRRGVIVTPVVIDGAPWPRRLEPRSSVTVYSHRPGAPEGASLRCAYARTQCGITETGTTPAMKQIAAEI